MPAPRKANLAPTLSRLLFASALVTAGLSLAQQPKGLKVYDIWARTTVPGQSVTAAYMHLKTSAPMKLVKAESPVAGMVEIHKMEMKDGIMRMAAVDSLDLPANTLIDLKPGGYHLMLMQLKAPIKAGDVVPIRLSVEDASKKVHVFEVTAKAQTKDPGQHKH